MRGSERLVDRVQALAMFFRKSGIQKRGKNTLFAFTLFVLLFGLTNTLYAGAEDDAYNVDQGATISENILENDSGLNERNHVVTTTGSFTTSKGSYTLSADGSLAYTANPLASGTDSFDYSISYQSWFLVWSDRTDDATVTITINTPVVENANDLCYGAAIEEPLDDIPYFHKRTVPIRNQGEGNLTDVDLVFATNGLLDIVPLDPEFDCGIDDFSRIASGECAYKDTKGLGELGLELDWLISTTLLHDALLYDMPDYTAYAPHTIYHKHGDNVDLSGIQIYASYIKDGTLYRGRIEECAASSEPPFQNEYTCGTFPSVLTSYEHMTLSKNQIFNSCTISYPAGEFSQDHNNPPVCYTDLTTSELCEDLDGIAENGNCNFVPEPLNRYDHDFIETTVNTSVNQNADITLTDLEYGNYTFGGNGQKIRFNPSSSYRDNNTKVMLLGDVDFTANSQVITFEEGDYYFRSLDITGNGLQLEPKGNVRIFIQGDLTLAKNNAAFSDPAASLFFFVGGDLSLSSQGGGTGSLSAFFYVKGDVAIDANSGNAEIYGGITAEGRIDVTGNGFTFKYNKYGADQFGLGECDLCYDPPTGPNGINILHLLGTCLPPIGPINLAPCDVYVPIKNISPIPLDNVQVIEARKSLLGIGLGSNHEVVDKEGINVPGTSAYKSSALYADLPLGLDIGLLNGYVIYDIGDGYHSYILTDAYYQLHKEAFISVDILDFSELIYFGKYTDDANRNYNIRLDRCREVDIPPFYQTGPFDAWDTFRGDTNGDGKFDDKNISTKIAGKTFSLTIANLDADQTGVEAKSIPSTVTYGLYDGISLIDGTIDTFDIQTTTAITKTYTDVSLASRNVHVGFTFCSLFDGTTYTLLEDGECSGNEIALCKNIDNSNPKWRKCYSSDAFAIRPKAFSITPPSGEDIGLLTSGSTYSFTVIAENENNTHTTGYNQEDNNLTIAQRLLFKNGDEDNQSILHGTLSFSNNNFLFVDGISTHRVYNTQTETVGITFSDVGRVDIILEDRQWGSVDSDDTPEGCDGGTLTNAKGIMLTIPDGTHICGENEATFIPDHFDLTGITLRNHNNEGNFTYLSNDLNMSAHVLATISAKNSQGAITQNFQKGAGFYENNVYENPVSVDLNVTDWNASLSNRHPLDNSVKIKDIPNETLLGFGGADEANGTHTITYESQRLLFNYKRNNNQPVNPFSVPVSDINITVASTYPGKSGTQKIVTGSGVGGVDSNATFYFGRAKASRDFYDVEGTVAKTPITVQVYCNVFPTCPLFPDTIQVGGQTDLSHWWLSLYHNEVSGDGEITLQDPVAVLGNGTASVDNDVNIENGVDETIRVTHQSGALPVTYDINMTAPPSTPITDSWLIYNAGSPTLIPNPFYKVRFTGDAGWAGVGATGHVLDINASGTETKRLNW
ncbi:MAG: Ig-like domain-containing protein [Sulfurovum sp.]|nr:Ig-like domain-containing protein [Sulfurovum sp.]